MQAPRVNRLRKPAAQSAIRTCTLAVLALSFHLATSATGSTESNTPGYDIDQTGFSPPCRLKRGALHTVTDVVDAETIRLDDGRLVRLIGARTPAPSSTAAGYRETLQERAARALTELVLGHSVRLYYPAIDRDRYGLTLAHVVREDSSQGRTWVQRHLVTNGHARTYVIPGNAECVDALAEAENRARNAGLGLWSLAAYRPIASSRTEHLRRLKETFQLVEGRITGVGSSRGNVYLNFGRNRRFAFTAFIARASLTGQRDWAKDLKTLKGRRIRVRGWIEIHNGPHIEVTHPNQIELLKKDQS
ncbi:thermonuclease family protein [Filomicrobium sp.]|uniref:thermonuclease family protein n=1 Tax=Filomicrobium sp. TaxID=2024831 RepID=UPI00258CCE4C|nr:thermonuclease family protein [Filomicrobium sp.]MCV0370738.1 thermonuclease family protein [Filomicrobium sp.]